MNNLKLMIPLSKVILGIAIIITVLVIGIIVLAIIAKASFSCIAISMITSVMMPWLGYYLLKKAIQMKQLRKQI